MFKRKTIKKNLLLIFILIFILISCTTMTVNSAYNSARNNNYTQAIERIETSLVKDTKNERLIIAYRDLYIRGINYYQNIGDGENIFLMESSYLNLPLEVKSIFNEIRVDKKAHKNRGIIVGRRLLNEAESIPTNSYREKIKKYKLYKYVLKFDPNLRNKIETKLFNLNKKIEKNYNIRSLGNNYFSNYLESQLDRNLDRTYFQIKEFNSDMTLYIRVDNFYYSAPKIISKTFPKHYKQKTIDANGKETINTIGYFENEYIKETSIEFFVSYELVSNISGEILFRNKKHIDKKYSQKWKTYYVDPFVANKDFNLPDDEREKQVPSKNEMMNLVIREVSDYINRDFKNLKKID